MKLILVPPYKGHNWTPEKGQFMLHELIDNMKEEGQLEGVEIDIDDGHPAPEEIALPSGSEEFYAHISLGVIKRVKEYSEMDKYDAIIQTGDLDPGFLGSRFVSKIPFVSVGHAAIHVASLVGERFSFFAVTDPCALLVRHFAQLYGFNHKLVSVRYPSYTSTYVSGFIKKYKKEERVKVPEVKKIIATLTTQCIAAIEEDRVDSLIIGCPVLQIFTNEVRQGLDEAGYGEIPLITCMSAGVEMAKVMVNMKLVQARRAYPGDDLAAKPAFR